MKEPVRVSDVVIGRIVVLFSQGMGQQKIARTLTQELGQTVTWRDVKAALETDKAKELLDDLLKTVMMQAKLAIRSGMSKLVPQAIDAVVENLKKKNLKAAQMVFEASGAIEKTPEENKSQNLTVVLPGMTEKEIIPIGGNDESDT